MWLGLQAEVKWLRCRLEKVIEDTDALNLEQADIVSELETKIRSSVLDCSALYDEVGELQCELDDEINEIDDWRNKVQGILTALTSEGITVHLGEWRKWRDGEGGLIKRPNNGHEGIDIVIEECDRGSATFFLKRAEELRAAGVPCTLFLPSRFKPKHPFRALPSHQPAGVTAPSEVLQ